MTGNHSTNRRGDSGRYGRVDTIARYSVCVHVYVHLSSSMSELHAESSFIRIHSTARIILTERI